MSNKQHRLNEYIQNYIVHSDYLPTNKVIDGRDAQVQQLVERQLIKLKQYEIQKSRGHVYTQRPVEFNPSRYVSVRTYEDVKIGQPISEEQFRNIARRQ